VAVLVGGTNGIGLSTLHALLKHTSTPTVYLVGRDSSRLTALIAQVQPLNPSATLRPVLANDLTLVRDAQKAAEEIAAAASRIDLLVVSAGFLSLSSKPDFSPEGLDRITAIRYHARMRFVVTLLPLLRKAPSPRVISVLAGGKEGPVDLSDLGMTRPDTYGFVYAAGASASMTTLFFEQVAQDEGNDKIVFIHIFPGLVADTGLKVQGGGIAAFIYEWVAKSIFRLIGISSAEAGERVLFAATNGRFRRLQGGSTAEGTLIQQGSDAVQGSGVYMVNADSSAVTGGGNADLKRLRAAGAGKKIYQYTMSEFERIERM